MKLKRLFGFGDPSTSNSSLSQTPSTSRKRHHAPSEQSGRPHKHARIASDPNSSFYSAADIIDALERSQRPTSWFDSFSEFAADAWSFVKGFVVLPKPVLFQTYMNNTQHSSSTRRGQTSIPQVDLTLDDDDEVQVIEPGSSHTDSAPSADRYAVRPPSPSMAPSATDRNDDDKVVRVNGHNGRDREETDDDEPVIVEEHLNSSSPPPRPASAQSSTSSTQRVSTHSRRSYLSPFLANTSSVRRWEQVTRDAPDRSLLMNRSRLVSDALDQSALQERRRYEQLLDSIGVRAKKPQSSSPPRTRFGYRPASEEVQVIYDSYKTKRDLTRQLLNECIGVTDAPVVDLADDSEPSSSSAAASPSQPTNVSDTHTDTGTNEQDTTVSLSYSPEIIDSLKHRFELFDPQKVIDAARAQVEAQRTQRDRSRALKNEISVHRDAREHRFRRQTEELYLKNQFTNLSILEFPEPLIKDEFPKITPEMDRIIENALHGGPLGQVLSKGFTFEITRKDLRTLPDLNWLNDEVINFYMAMLAARSETKQSKAARFPRTYAMTTFFYPKVVGTGYSGVRRWTKRVDLFSYDMVLVPVHLGLHWCLALVDFRFRMIRYFDSMGGHNVECVETLKKYLQDESKDKRGVPFDMSEWDLRIEQDIPQQQNGSDCGMFTCRFAEYCTRDAVINFNQTHMPYFRRRTIYEIVTQKLLL